MSHTDTQMSTKITPTEEPENLGITILSIFFVCVGGLFFLYIFYKVIRWLFNKRTKRENKEKIAEGFSKVCEGCRKVSDYCTCKEEEKSSDVIDDNSQSNRNKTEINMNLCNIKEEEEEETVGDVVEDNFNHNDSISSHDEKIIIESRTDDRTED